MFQITNVPDERDKTIVTLMYPRKYFSLPELFAESHFQDSSYYFSMIASLSY